MLVMVRYVDDEYGIVEDYCLDYLIATGKVVEFARTNEWVSIGSDPIRGAGGETYHGPERRGSVDIATAKAAGES